MSRDKYFNDLLVAFRQSLEENGENDMAAQIPFVGEKNEYRGETFEKEHIQLFSIVAHLLNMVEVKAAVDERRARKNPICEEWKDCSPEILKNCWSADLLKVKS